MECHMTIYRDMLVKIISKGFYKRNKHIKPLRYGFHKNFGDIPVVTFNNITKTFEVVENRRGLSYAYRNDVKNWKKSKWRKYEKEVYKSCEAC